MDWAAKPMQLKVDQCHQLKVHTVSIVLKDDRGTPIENERFILTGSDEFVFEGRTGPGGRARVVVPPGTGTSISFPDLCPDAWDKE